MPTIKTSNHTSHSGFFVHGGRLGEMYVKDKVDADLIAEALNMAERLNTKAVQRRIEETLSALESLQNGMKDGTGY